MATKKSKPEKSTASKVGRINEKTTQKKAPVKKPLDDRLPNLQKDEEFTLTFKMHNGKPMLPGSLIQLEVGLYDDPYAAKANGYTQLGIVRIAFGIRPPGSRFCAFMEVDHKIERIGTTEKWRLISPFWVKQDIKSEDHEDAGEKLFPCAFIHFKALVVRRISRIINEGRASSSQSVWAKNSGAKVFFNCDLDPQSEDTVESIEGYVE